MRQVAELPLNLLDASHDSQAENQVLLSSLKLLWRSVLWPLAGCKCRDTNAGRLEASWSDCAPVKTLSQPCLWWQYPELVPLSPHHRDDLQNLWSTWWYPTCPHLQWQHWNMNLYTPVSKKCFSCSSLKGFTSWQSIFRPFFIGTEPLWMSPLSLTPLTP